MATTLWQGGTTAVTQIETFTLNNDFNDSETALTMTMTAEDGTSTQTVAIDPSGVDESAIAALWETALDASTDTLFIAVTWSVSTNVVTGTAKIAGVPFYAASSVTGGAGTVTDSISTASAGPFDWNTSANFSGSAVPSSADLVYILPHPTDEKSYDIKYGLDQNAVSLNQLRVGEAYDGSIGDSVNSYYLRISVANASPKQTILNGKGEANWIKGTLTNVYVKRAVNSKDAVHLAGDIDDLYISGSNVQGTVTVVDSATLDNVHIHGALGATVILGKTLSSFDLLEMDGGNVTLKSELDDAGVLRVTGGTLTVEIEAWSASGGTDKFLYVHGGMVKFNAGGTLDDFIVYGGHLNFDENESSGLTITDSVQFGGLISANSGLSNLTWTADVVQHGGSSDGDVTVTPQAS